MLASYPHGGKNRDDLARSLRFFQSATIWFSTPCATMGSPL